MKKDNKRSEDVYNWNEVSRPDHLRFVFSSVATALDIDATQSVIVGRGAEEGIIDVDLTPYQAADLGVSRQHIMIAPEGDGFVIKDLGSSNGTILNGETLEKDKNYPIHDGDMLYLGRMGLTVRFVHHGVRLDRRLPRLAVDPNDEAQKRNTRMLRERRLTQTVEMRGLLNKLKNTNTKDKK